MNTPNDRRQKRHVILMTSPDCLQHLTASDWIYRRIIPTLQRLSKEKRFELTLSSFQEEDHWAAPELVARHVSGVLWMGNGDGELFSSIARQVRVVAVNADLVWPPQTRVVTDERMVLHGAAKHLADLGHQRIAYFNADPSGTRFPCRCRERLHAYHEAITRLELEEVPELCLPARFGTNEHPQAVSSTLDRLLSMPVRPTGLIAPLQYAIEFVKQLRARKLSVPTDLSIVAIDDAMAAGWVDPPLTAIDCRLEKCAEIALDLLFDETALANRFSGAIAQTILVEPELVVRESTSGRTSL